MTGSLLTLRGIEGRRGFSSVNMFIGGRQWVKIRACGVWKVERKWGVIYQEWEKHVFVRFVKFGLLVVGEDERSEYQR